VIVNQWSQPEVRLVRVELHAAAARAAVGGPGGELVIEPGPHVAACYQILIGDRVVLEDAVTLHGPALAGAALLTGEALPGDVHAAVEALWSHAKEKIAEHAGLPPPSSLGSNGA
jgi:hypothetical protein